MQPWYDGAIDKGKEVCSMIHHRRETDVRRTIVCVDSYEDGILKGWFYNSCQEPESFSSLSQFLLKMEQMLDEIQIPQAYTALRTFSAAQDDSICLPAVPTIRGARATFELRVSFRQHTSWQGSLLWRERKLRQSFRSVLELVSLMDSALRNPERSDSA